MTHPVDINFQDPQGNTALHLAVYLNSLDKVPAALTTQAQIKLVLRLGGSTAAQNHKGQTPLMVATKWKSLEVFNLLMQSASKQALNLVDANRNSLGHYVCRHNLKEYLLCLHGSDIDMAVRNKYGLLPFELCTDPETHAIFSKLSQAPDHPVFGRRVMRDGKLLLTSRFDRVRNILQSQRDYRERVKQAQDYGEKVASSRQAAQATDPRENKSERAPINPASAPQKAPTERARDRHVPGEFLDADFEFAFPFVADFLKHCNEFKSFQFERPIGIGGFGEVWRVLNTRTQRKLAVKVINIKSKVSRKTLRNLARVERDIMSGLDHPFICKCLYSFKSQKRFYLFMEFCPYRDLGFLSRVVLNGFKSRMVRLFLAELVLAVGHLHANSIIHRDIKTQNVLMDRAGHVKLTGRPTNRRLRSGQEERAHASAHAMRHARLQLPRNGPQAPVQPDHRLVLAGHHRLRADGRQAALRQSQQRRAQAAHSERRHPLR